ncbi:PBECR4 domain-containing protein [Paenibacillus sp. OK003]|uniref:PBECR4 domain-containing protein n=1 Tax=Paenibacillus sp. OK003 TaxID=1884380 RepID=UPI0008B1F829|nr:PBECR4 domain-containing protein [Paenibacillus sp. OK003]SEL93393.1 hypothetical protein SAMN05518856_12434 [Paenibacillus sp. OK003]
MSLSVSDLLTIDYIPEPEDLSLQTIALFYEEHLMNKQFLFRVKHKVGEIRIRFEEGTLPHLMAIHKFINGQAGKSLIAHRGMINGQITLESLKQMNVGSYEKFKYRMTSLPLIHQIVNCDIAKPTFIELDPRENEARANWQVSNKQYGKMFVQLKLRLVKDGYPNCFAPVSIEINRQLPPKKRIGVKEIIELPFGDGWQ